MGHDNIIESLGGWKQASADLSMPLQRVRFWHRRKFIPPGYWAEIIALGKRKGVKITERQLAETMPRHGDDPAREHKEHAPP